MSGRKKKYTPEFKSQLAVEALRDRYPVAEIASNFEVHASLVHAWRQLLKKCVVSVFKKDAEDDASAGRDEIRQMEQRIRELREEQEWMIAAAANRLDLHSRRELIDPEDSELSILRQSRLLGLHRSGFYYQKRGGREAGQVAGAEHDPITQEETAARLD